MNTFESQYYESSEFWSQGAVTDPANLARIEASIGLIPPDVKSLVDVGCGNGVFLSRLEARRSVPRMLGIDRSKEALSYLKGPALIADITSITLDDRSYDCVCCLQVLEHLPVPMYEKARRELCRIADRYVIVSVPYRERIEANMTQCPQCRTIFNIDLHLRSYDDAALNDLFQADGFRLAASLDPYPRVVHLGSALMRGVRRMLLRTGRKRVFRSPLCPLCGWCNTAFQFGLPAADAPGLKLRTRLARIGPRLIRPGYWKIALYQREARTAVGISL